MEVKNDILAELFDTRIQRKDGGGDDETRG